MSSATVVCVRLTFVDASCCCVLQSPYKDPEFVLEGDERSLEFFALDGGTGQISVRQDLRLNDQLVYSVRSYFTRSEAVIFGRKPASLQLGSFPLFIHSQRWGSRNTHVFAACCSCRCTYETVAALPCAATPRSFSYK